LLNAGYEWNIRLFSTFCTLSVHPLPIPGKERHPVAKFGFRKMGKSDSGHTIRQTAGMYFHTFWQVSYGDWWSKGIGLAPIP
jgi:hypothetical protein